MHRVAYFAVIDPVAHGTPGVIARDGVDPLPDQFLDEQAGAHVGQQRFQPFRISRHDQVLRTACIRCGF